MTLRLFLAIFLLLFLCFSVFQAGRLLFCTILTPAFCSLGVLTIYKLQKLPSPDKGFLLIKRGQAMVQATFTIQIWVAFSLLSEGLPHTRMNWPDARSAAVASDISDLAPPS
jgi:hypothetical protein